MSRSEEFHFGAAHMGRLEQYTAFHNKAAVLNIETGYAVQHGHMSVPEHQEMAHEVSKVQKDARKLNKPAGKPQTFVGNSSLKNVPGKHGSLGGAPRQRPKYN